MPSPTQADLQRLYLGEHSLFMDSDSQVSIQRSLGLIFSLPIDNQVILYKLVFPLERFVCCCISRLGQFIFSSYISTFHPPLNARCNQLLSFRNLFDANWGPNRYNSHNLVFQKDTLASSFLQELINFQNIANSPDNTVLNLFSNSGQM